MKVKGKTVETVAQTSSVKKGALGKLAKLTGKHLCQSLKKETLAQVLSCEFCETSKNTFFYRKPLVAASETIQLLTDA